MARASLARSASTPSLGSRPDPPPPPRRARVRARVRAALARARRRAFAAPAAPAEVPPTADALAAPVPAVAAHAAQPAAEKLWQQGLPAPPPQKEPPPPPPPLPPPLQAPLPQKLARKNMLLRCLEFGADGGCTPRDVTRQDVLDHARAHGGAVSGRGAAATAPRAPRAASERRGAAARAAAAARAGGGRGGRPRGRAPPPPLSAAFLQAQRTRQHLSRNALTMRDLRQIDPDFTAKPALWVRQHALVVSLEGVRAIVLCDRMFLFDPGHDAVQGFVKYLRRNLAAAGADFAPRPFEFRALDAILEHACYQLSRTFGDIKPDIQTTLGLLPTRITAELLDRLRKREHSLKAFDVRARKVQHVLQSLLDEDDDMADMYLTEMSSDKGITRLPLHHNEAETLLETHLQTVDDLTSKAELLRTTIDDTEDLIEIHLDTMQNRLLLVDLIITAITTILSFGSMVTGIFGMNLQLPHQMRFLPTSAYYFYGTVSATGIAMAVSLLVLVRWCHRQGLRSSTNTAKGRWRRRNGEKRVSDDRLPAANLLVRSLPLRGLAADEALARLRKKPS